MFVKFKDAQNTKVEFVYSVSSNIKMKMEGASLKIVLIGQGINAFLANKDTKPKKESVLSNNNLSATDDSQTMII